MKITKSPPIRPAPRCGFTLVEMLMVIVAMAIFAGVIIPQIGATVDDAKESAVLSSLHEMTNAIERYRIEHDGKPPDDLTGSTLPQLTGSTSVRGAIGAGPSYPLGPYIFEVPVNPYNNSSAVARTLTSPPGNFRSAAGWLYHVESGQIWPSENPLLVVSGPSIPITP